MTKINSAVEAVLMRHQAITLRRNEAIKEREKYQRWIDGFTQDLLELDRALKILNEGD